MILRIILIIIVALILSYGAWAYVDKILEDKHKEMMCNYEHSCNGGMTDEEMREKSEDK
jgi:hypothetical protein